MFQNDGYCYCCDSRTQFVAKSDWWRDDYRCTNCNSLPRERALMFCIERFFPQWRSLSIHESSPVLGRGANRRLTKEAPASFSGIDLREDRQLALLEKLSRYYAEIPFPAEKNERFRFAFDNPSYSWADAIILFCMIRELKPSRILEIGSGHTSALILDTNERYFGGGIDCTFVEPHPQLLLSLLRPNEDRETRVIPRKLRDVNLTLFDTLEAGDILFIDSSHVVKAGNDCHLLFSDVLPRLNPGTLIHFHDVFERFEYPRSEEHTS